MLLGISLGFNLNLKEFNNAIQIYKGKDSAINESIVGRKVEIDKYIFPHLENPIGMMLNNIIVTTR